MQLRALRGAILCSEDTKEEVTEKTAQLLREMIERNDIRPDDIMDIIFTATEDLTTEFPAAAARHIGLTHVPLLCARELPIEGSPRKCIRVMMHFYTRKHPHELRHPYLEGARQLRTDLPE
ncbi:MAG: chorismate mutase [Actinomycetota bacterium]|nr:chorismate mutase [Actinomycetota bacterium]